MAAKLKSNWSQRLHGRKKRPLEWVSERLIFIISLSAIVTIFLIFIFVAIEALPIFLQKAPGPVDRKIIPSSQIDTLSDEQLRGYLQLSAADFKKKNRDTLKLLMDVREEAAKEIPDDKDAHLNTTRWRYLLLPYQWSDYDSPVFIWQPVSSVKKFNIVPLLAGSLKVTLIALLFSVPLSLAAAIYVSQLARPRVKEIAKPCIELLSGIPSVVMGFFALIVMATILQKIFGYTSRLNAFLAGIALGLAVIPVIFSIAEDALTSVPRSYSQAALALGSSRWQAAWKVVFPAAMPGVFAAVILGFGRAVGETMIVLMASGNASILSWNIFDSTRTITATIAAELAEAVQKSPHYGILFMIGTLLLAITCLSNLAGDIVMRHLKQRLEGKR